MTTKITLCSIAWAAGLAFSAFSQTTVEITPGNMSHLYEYGYSTPEYSRWDEFRISYYSWIHGGRAGRYGYASYDLSALPAGAVITAAQWRYNCTEVPYPNDSHQVTFLSLAGSPADAATDNDAADLIQNGQAIQVEESLSWGVNTLDLGNEAVASIQAAADGGQSWHLGASKGYWDQGETYTLGDGALLLTYNSSAVAYDSVAVAGSFNDWNTTTNRLTEIASGIWQLDVNLSTLSNITFKFHALEGGNESWFGDADQGAQTMTVEGTVDNPGADIVLQGPFSADVRFTFFANNQRYQVETLDSISSVSVAGTFNDWNTTTHSLTEIGSNRWQGTFRVASMATNGGERMEFKFVKNQSYSMGTWGRRYTSAPLPLNMSNVQASTATDAGNFAVLGPFNADIRFTLDLTNPAYPHASAEAMAYYSSYTNIVLYGSLNGWASPLGSLTNITNNLWRLDLPITSSTDVEFKFQSPDDNTWWGLDEEAQTGPPLWQGACSGSGGNLTLAAPLSGTYTFSLDSYTLGYSVSNGVMTDSDLDGIPDHWEGGKGLNATNAADAAIDQDLDGHTALEEYIADTDPFSSNDVLALKIVWEGGNMVVDWPSSASRKYTLRYTDSFSGTSDWTAVSSMQDVYGNGTNLQYIKAGSELVPRRLYGIQAELP